MGHLRSHGPRGAYVTENDDGSSSLPFSVMDGGDRVFDRRFKSITPDEDTIRRQVNDSVLPHCRVHRIRSGFAANSVQNSNYLGHGTASRVLPRPTGHFFRNEVEESDFSQDIGTDNGVADGV